MARREAPREPDAEKQRGKPRRHGQKFSGKISPLRNRGGTINRAQVLERSTNNQPAMTRNQPRNAPRNQSAGHPNGSALEQPAACSPRAHSEQGEWRPEATVLRARGHASTRDARGHGAEPYSHERVGNPRAWPPPPRQPRGGGARAGAVGNGGVRANAHAGPTHAGPRSPGDGRKGGTWEPQEVTPPLGAARDRGDHRACQAHTHGAARERTRRPRRGKTLARADGPAHGRGLAGPTARAMARHRQRGTARPRAREAHAPASAQDFKNGTLSAVQPPDAAPRKAERDQRRGHATRAAPRLPAADLQHDEPARARGRGRERRRHRPRRTEEQHEERAAEQPERRCNAGLMAHARARSRERRNERATRRPRSTAMERRAQGQISQWRMSAEHGTGRGLGTAAELARPEPLDQHGTSAYLGF